jgi:CheY-like chemotaxis protein
MGYTQGGSGQYWKPAMSDYILVVDDEPDIRELFNIMLTMAGFKIQTAEDGRKAMQAIAKSAPTLVLLDLMMPYMDGFEVLDGLRGDNELLGVRVLVVTAKSLNDGDKKKLAGWPVVGTLNKGELDLTHMVTLVQDALKHKPPASNGEGDSSPPAKDDGDDTPSGRPPAGGERSNGPLGQGNRPLSQIRLE